MTQPEEQMIIQDYLNGTTFNEIIEKYHDKFFEEESEFTEFNKRLSDQNKIIEVIK